MSMRARQFFFFPQLYVCPRNTVLGERNQLHIKFDEQFCSKLATFEDEKISNE